MKAGDPFPHSSNAAIIAAARTSVNPLGRQQSYHITRSKLPTLPAPPQLKQNVAGSPLKGFKMKNRNLPKLEGGNMPTLPQLGRMNSKIPGGMRSRMPGGMKKPSLKPRKLPSLGAKPDDGSIAAAAKGKKLLNEALGGSSHKKKHRRKDKKSKKKHRKKPPGTKTSNSIEPERAVVDPAEEAAEQAIAYLADLLDSKKGRGILVQEAKICKALREGRLVDLQFERANANQSLGIAFTIPARVSAMDWTSQQRLIVGSIKDDSPAERAKIKEDDIVVKVNNRECKSITEFKEDISGKTSFVITIARCKGLNVADIKKVRKNIEEQVRLTARKRAEENNLFNSKGAVKSSKK